MSSTIKIIRGDDVVLPVTFTDEDGDAIDITGATVFFTVKPDYSADDTDALIAKEITSHTGPSLGQTTITLDDTDTALDGGVYIWDLQIKYSNGKFSSTIAGKLELIRDVTIRQS